MKIGIITWFTGPNYGTNLQAIALQYYLRKQGHEVNIINYEVLVSQQGGKKRIFQKIISQPKKYLVKLVNKKYDCEILIRDKRLKQSINKNCILTKKINTENEFVKVCNEFDLLICGSDQIWNPNWYHPFYFADYEDIDTRRISYAPSVGVDSVPNKVIPQFLHSINNFSHISVREDSAADLIEFYTKERPQVVVDPTLLLGKEDWERIFPKKVLYNNSYVLGIFLNDKLSHLLAAKKYAKSQQLDYVIVPYKGITYLQRGKICADAGLDEIINLIRGAQYILTDSFHITVFSILYERQFYIFQRFREDEVNSQNTRITNLLNMVGLEERLVPYGTRKINHIQDIDYSKYITNLKIVVEKSKKYLFNAINEEK